jgi:ubiquinone/menaquinone biosynthesis C-methylase UbiE
MIFAIKYQIFYLIGLYYWVMVNYDVFAEFYDPVMGERTDNIELIQGLIEQYNPQAKSVLELATGTGSVLKGLAEKYQVSGLDLSTEMLNKAKLKVPQAELHQRNMANFDIGKTFDVIICVFDSINHLETFDTWQQMFSSTYRHLLLFLYLNWLISSTANGSHTS